MAFEAVGLHEMVALMKWAQVGRVTDMCDLNSLHMKKSNTAGSHGHRLCIRSQKRIVLQIIIYSLHTPKKVTEKSFLTTEFVSEMKPFLLSGISIKELYR